MDRTRSVCEAQMPPVATKSKSVKISYSYIFTRQTPGACDFSEVWAAFRWTYSPTLFTVWPPKLKILHLIIMKVGLDLRTNGLVKRQMIQLLNAPGRVFWPGAYKLPMWTRHVFVKHGCPRRQQSQTMAKISKSYILTTPHPRGHAMSVKCVQPLDELTVQVWLLYDHPNFKYCTLVYKRDGITDRRTDRRSKH